MDNAIRRQALDPTLSFIVEAPAGSGKTELLVQRFLSLLATCARFPEEILAITFTRKAAHEMRSRIINALEKALINDTQTMQSVTIDLAQKVLLRDKKENWQLLANPNRLYIQTIDALCMRLTSQMPIVSGVGGQVRMSNNSDEIYQKTIRAILETLDEDTPWKNALISVFQHFDNQYSLIESVFIDMLKKRDQWLPYVIGIPDDRALKKQFEKHLENIVLDRLSVIGQSFPQDLVQTLLPLARYAGLDCNEWPSLTCDDLPKWLAIIELLLTKDGDYRKQVDKRQGFPPNVNNTYKKDMQELLSTLQAHEELRFAMLLLREAPPLHYTLSSWEFLQALLTVLPIMAAQLLLTFQHYGQVDFIEIASRALQALGEPDNPTDLAQVLDYQLQHILVDEFQDTSMTQFKLLEKLTNGWSSQDHHTLFLVGDPMQSIYRFRQANVGLFLKAKQQGINDIPLIPLKLTMNFRSQPSLIDWINQVMPDIMPKTANITLGAIPFTQCQAARVRDETGLIKCIKAEDPEQEAILLVQHLQQIKQHYPHWRCAILVRARSHLSDILPQLKAHGLAFQALEIEPLSKHELIHDLLALTRALLHPYDNIAWLALLRSPVCGLDLGQIETLINFKENAAIWDILQDSDAIALLSSNAKARVEGFTAALKPTLDARDRMPLALWVESAWAALGGVSYTKAQDVVNSATFYKLLDFLEQEYQVLDMHILQQQIDKLYTDQMDSDLNPIQVMTIHKAKGLEFDAVFLPGLTRRPANNTPVVLRYFEQTLANGTHWLLAPVHGKTLQSDPIYNYLGRVEKYQQNYETQRLLYVALTRAKQQLYLFAVLDPERPSPAPQSLFALLSSSFDHETICYPAHVDSTLVQNESGLKRLPLNWQLPEPWHNWLNEHKTNIPEDNTVDSTAFEPNVIMRKHVGTLLHRILKYFADTGIRKVDLARWRIQLIELGVSASELDTGLSLLNQAVQGILNDPKGQWILQAHEESACEYALHTVYNNKPTRIVMDRTFVDNNQRWIIDYKLGVPDEIETYAHQLQHYAQILRQIDKRPIRLGLYFPLTTTWKELVCNS